MDAQEFDVALTELETRVDRLRALYENWFRGYEKAEPAVARKDVERRVYGMRKELPRNTALRFRYHQLYQRYTTLLNYWQRTGRQIEEGTYKLHLQKVKRKRVEQETSHSRPPEAQAEGDHTLDGKSYSLNLDETLDVGKLLNDFDLDEVADAIDQPGPYSPALAPAPQASRPSIRFSRPNEANASVLGAPANAGNAGRPSLPFGEPASSSSFLIPSLSPGPFARPSMPNTPPISVRAPDPPLSGLPPAPTVNVTGVAPAPSMPSVRPAAPARPSVPLVPAARPSMSLPPAPARSGAPPPAPARATPSLPPRPSAPQAPSDALAEPRLRRLYDEYAAARRKNNEGEVRYETLASSIQKMLPELRKKHVGKQIDFEIVMKDGRVGLKPKAT